MLAMEERALALKAKKPELDDLKQALGIDRITVQVEELEQQALAEEAMEGAGGATND